MGKFKQFDIHEIIEAHSLDIDEISKLLFPYVKYPKQAFDRVLNGETELDVMQLAILASHVGVLVSDLFTMDGWHGKATSEKLTFTKGDYKAVVNSGNGFIALLRDNMCLNIYIGNTQVVTISEFINIINNLILQYEKSTESTN